MTETPPTSRTRLSDIRLLIYAIIGLTLIAVIVVIFVPPDHPPALTIRSDQADGSLALRLWLEQNGYSVKEILSDPIKLESQDALFILNPLEPYTSTEAQVIRDWVRKGRTLIIAGEPMVVSDLLAAFDVTTTWTLTENAHVSQAAPLLNNPPADTARAEPVYMIHTTHTDVTVHIFSDNEPVLISFREGRGTVWVSGMLRPFSNRGLHDNNNAALILNMLSNVTTQGVLAFDEARHGYGTSNTLQAWLFNTAPGWGVLLAIILTMIFLAMRGRRFGQAVPLPDNRLRREPVEYIQAIANLFRRSGQRTEMLKHYRTHLRRRLSERFTLDPHLNDVELVKAVSFRDPDLDGEALRNVLQRLSRKQISEAELVKVAADVDSLLRTL